MTEASPICRSPTARCLAGIATVDITPPVGIYHRFWGAASHDKATGVHRPLRGSVLILADVSDDEKPPLEDCSIIIALDHCLFRPDDMDRFRAETVGFLNVNPQQLIVTFSHTHSGGHIARARGDLPGGELIGPYLDSLPEKIANACRSAFEALQPVTMTAASAPCAMGHQRDFRDPVKGETVCGFNPDDDTVYPVTVMRMCNAENQVVGTIVNYPCHPTTLAWENTLISPDYIGATREIVERATAVPCLFLLAPCGDVGPRYGFVGDVEVADANGRQLGYAALSALESMDPPGSDYVYGGPVISGATLGTWYPKPQTKQRIAETSHFQHDQLIVEVPYLDDLQTVEETEQEFAEHLAAEQSCRERGDEKQARDHRALAERCRRTLERIRPLPKGAAYPYRVEIFRLGDLIWIFVEGEPYHEIQKRLTERFPKKSIMLITLTDGARCGYLPIREAYTDASLYQVQIAVVAPGSLETIADAVIERVKGK
ncbi:MAG: hypothetical protein Tsb009_36370 [Planctomycetaceae bacterium]